MKLKSDEPIKCLVKYFAEDEICEDEIFIYAPTSAYSWTEEDGQTFWDYTDPEEGDLYNPYCKIIKILELDKLSLVLED